MKSPKVVRTVSRCSTENEGFVAGRMSYPSLQWSSDGSSSDGEEQKTDDVPGQSMDEMDMPLNARDGKLSKAGRELLQSVTALHMADSDMHLAADPFTRRRRPGVSMDAEESPRLARSSISSPGRSSHTLRERFQRLSRLQRKRLLLKNGQAAETARMARIKPESRGFEGEFQPPAESVPPPAPTCPSDEESPAVKRRPQPVVSRSLVQRQLHVNRIKLHVYDLIAKDTLMMLPPFGCIVEIGKCFNDVNTALHQLGTGAYHVGVEVNGIEYAYGATSTPGKTGVFSCIPTLSPGYQYRSTIDLGMRELVRRSWVAVDGGDGDTLERQRSNIYQEVEEYIDGRQVIKEMAKDYIGRDYDILRKNCCTFARDACLRLGVEQDEIPSWFRNLAESGAKTQDMALATVQPLTSVLSSCEDESAKKQIETEFGYEMIAKQNEEGTKDIVIVVDLKPQRRISQGQLSPCDLQRNATWAY